MLPVGVGPAGTAEPRSSSAELNTLSEMIESIPSVTRERLLSLLSRQAESFDLDYKSKLDFLNSRHHRLRLVKLVAAITARSGDIVVGKVSCPVFSHYTTASGGCSS